MNRRLETLFAVVLATLFATTTAPAQTCVGDCNDNGNVSSPEISRAVLIALSDVSLEDCEAADANNDDVVDIVDLTIIVNEHLSACTFATPTPTATFGVTLPDLVPDRATFRGITGACPLSENAARLEVCVRNVSSRDAEAFDVLVYGTAHLAFPPLGAGTGACVITDYLGAEVSVVIDPNNLIQETNKANNTRVFDVPGETPGPTCTATITRSPTVTRTPLPPGSPSPTPEATDTATQTPPASATPTRTITRTPTCACTFTATQRTETPTPTPSPTATRTPGLPDLVPNRIVVIAPTPIAGCVNSYDEIELSLELCVLNDGTGDAGPFTSSVRITAEVDVPFPAGAPADTEVCSAASFLSGQLIFDVDTQEEIDEAVESNNSQVFQIVRPTPPPLCPTRTPTPH